MPELPQAFFADVKEVDRDNEVNRVLWAFKLNPYEKLNLRFDATVEDIRKAYRKLSLMVHPDKCKHPKAGDAFDSRFRPYRKVLHACLQEYLLLPTLAACVCR